MSDEDGLDDEIEDSGGGRLPRPTTWPDRVVYLLSEYKVAIMVAGLAGLVLLVSGRWDLPTVPPGWRLFLKAVAIGLVPSTLAGKVLIVDRFMPDPRLNIGVVTPQEGGLIDVKKVTNGVWRNRNRGKWQEYQPDRGPCDYVVTSFEWDDKEKKLSVEGVNPELTDAIEMIGVEGRIDEIYEELMEDRYRLLKLLKTLPSKALEYDKRQTMALLSSIEHGTAFDPGGGVSDIFDAEEIEEEIEAGPAEADDKNPRTPDPYAQSESGDKDRLSLQELLDVNEREMRETLNGSDRNE